MVFPICRRFKLIIFPWKADPSLTAKELTEFCNNHPMLAKYKRPRFYRFVEELPYTATGKKMYFKVKEHAVEDLKNGLLDSG